MRRLAPLAVVALVTGCGGSHAARPTISASARTALVDAPPSVVIRGEPSHARVVVLATTESYGTPFAGRVVLHADGDGVVRVPTGPLLSSMHPPGVRFNYGDSIPWSGQLVSISSGALRVRFRLLLEAPQVVERDLRPQRSGFYGDFFHLPGTRRGPAVLVFGGSEGGLSTAGLGALLASRGIPALALAYFGEPGLPAALSRIPLEYFARALRWLSRQPDVDPHRLAVDGGSRGSEAALLLGLRYPSLVHKVVALSPSDVVIGRYPGCCGAAWTFRGKDIPFQPYFGPVGPAEIPVGRIKAALFLDCGGADRIWPSCEMAHEIVQKRHGRGVTLLSYPEAGHGVDYLLPNTASSSSDTDGSTPEANADARRAAWPKLLAFLRSP
jgi:dienelactone hydrolase